ncbi:hypothetical protein HKX48_000335 [Thoreauomyces humboldtii]|nr:hypothetical protein HKX48_000335 [Thoreauomyces humboldtii]
MTVEINSMLPDNVKDAGVDNAALVRIPEDADGQVFGNSTTYAERGDELFLSVYLKDSTKNVTLRGPIGERREVALDNSGVDFVYVFHAKQHKIFDDEETFDGTWTGVLQFSKFRWVARELKTCTEEEFTAAVEKFNADKAAAAASTDSVDGAALLKEGTVAIKAGKQSEAIDLLTRAFVTCEIDDEEEEEEEKDEDEEETDPHASLRIQVLAARAQASYELKAYRKATRDCELIESIYGRPMEALNRFEQFELGVYFKSLITSARSFEALGNKVHAGAGYMAIMILRMIQEQKADGEADGESFPDPVVPELAEELIAEADKGIERLNVDNNMTTVYRLRISLLGVSPEVWRSVEVTASDTFGDLREYITVAFGWCGAPNQHEFEVYDHGVVRFTTMPTDEDEEEVDPDLQERHEICEDEENTTIGLAVSKVGDSFTYIYENGDWVHQIVVEEVREEVIEDGCCGGEEDEGDDDHVHEHKGPEYPKVVAGARACPPDEVGGPAGYVQFLAAASGTPTDRFEDRIAALTFASENVGFSNAGLASWPGAEKHSFDIEEIDDEEAPELEEEKDLSVGGWDPEAFDLENTQKALSTIASMMADGSDEDWEDEETDDEAEEDL